jgi:hypothetical protein
MSYFARLLPCALFVAACGSSSPGSVSGTIHGVTYSVGDAISAAVSETDNGVTSHFAFISLVSIDGACADIGSNSEPPNVKSLAISLADYNGTVLNAPTATGSYTIYDSTAGGTPPTLYASASAGVTDATCTTITADSASAMTGTVTLTSVSGNVFDGSFDIMMNSGDHVTGSFSPEACPAIQNLVGSTMSPACT